MICVSLLHLSGSFHFLRTLVAQRDAQQELQHPPRSRSALSQFFSPRISCSQDIPAMMSRSRLRTGILVLSFQAAETVFLIIFVIFISSIERLAIRLILSIPARITKSALIYAPLLLKDTPVTLIYLFHLYI